MSENNLDLYFAHVQKNGKLPTLGHAKRWSDAALKTLGLNIDRSVKKELLSSLPEELKNSLNGVFWLAHFRNTNMPGLEFQNAVARRAGNSDKQFARYPVLAVFGGLKQLVKPALVEKIADCLAPEIRELWDQA